jgi:hypothetical protein
VTECSIFQILVCSLNLKCVSSKKLAADQLTAARRHFSTLKAACFLLRVDDAAASRVTLLDVDTRESVNDKIDATVLPPSAGPHGSRPAPDISLTSPTAKGRLQNVAAMPHGSDASGDTGSCVSVGSLGEEDPDDRKRGYRVVRITHYGNPSTIFVQTSDLVSFFCIKRVSMKHRFWLVAQPT